MNDKIYSCMIQITQAYVMLVSSLSINTFKLWKADVHS